MNRDAAIANPQLWNLYAYCQNSPVTLLDPDGRSPADWASAIDQAVESTVDWVDQNTTEGTVSTTLNDAAEGAGFLVSGAADMLRVGDATGEVIGEGGDGYAVTEAVSQDVGRGAALFVTLGSFATPLSGGGPRAGLSSQAQRGIRSLEKRIAEHETKLKKFKANPTVRSGMQKLSKDAIKRQQQARIKHLKNEIRVFKDNIKKLSK